jgi:acetolactate synthase small subunit
MNEQRWIFVIKIIHKPGVLNAVTGVFSSWGISLETAMLNAMGSEGSDSIVILSFACNQRKMEIMERTVSRLSCVKELNSYPYETTDLRMIAACTVDANYKYEKSNTIEIEEYIRKDNSKILYVSGTVKDVDAFISPMLEKKEMIDLIRTILTI